MTASKSKSKLSSIIRIIFFTFFDKKIQYIRTNKTFESQMNSRYCTLIESTHSMEIKTTRSKCFRAYMFGSLLQNLRYISHLHVLETSWMLIKLTGERKQGDTKGHTYRSTEQQFPRIGREPPPLF